MINEVLDSWGLFWPGWLACLAGAVLLPLLGILLMARRQLFLGAAVSQFAGFGVVLAACIAASMAPPPAAPPPQPPARAAVNAAPAKQSDDPLDEFMRKEGVPPAPEPPAVQPAPEPQTRWLDEPWFRLLLAVCCAVAASLVAARGGEKRTAVLFVAGSVGALLASAYSPHGSEEIGRMLASSLVTATPTDAWLMVGCLFLASLTVALRGREVLLWAVEPILARACGIPTGAYAAGWALFAGAVLGLGMYAGGLLFTFGTLLLPTIAARIACRSLRGMMITAPLTGLLIAVLGIVLAHHYDMPPAQVIVALMLLLLPVAALARIRKTEPLS